MINSPASAIAPVIRPAASARRRNDRSSHESSCRAASAARYTAARYAQLVTASSPMKTDVGLSQLQNGAPAALPTGTRSVAMPPIAAPSANGVRIEEIEKVFWMILDSRGPAAPARTAYAAPRKMIPSPAMNSGIASVDAIEPNAFG